MSYLLELDAFAVHMNEYIKLSSLNTLNSELVRLLHLFGKQGQIVISIGEIDRNIHIGALDSEELHWPLSRIERIIQSNTTIYDILLAYEWN